MELVSMIIPVYGVEVYLGECLETVLNQTYENLEIILIDDESPDHCPEICDQYAQKMKNQGDSSEKWWCSECQKSWTRYGNRGIYLFYRQ